jgi:hypothetical protein
VTAAHVNGIFVTKVVDGYGPALSRRSGDDGRRISDRKDVGQRPDYIAGMRRLRRATAVFSALFVLLLVFVESGYACAMPRMGGMSMAQGAHAASPMPAHHQSPCRFPWAPDGCQSMAPCAPATLVTASQMLTDPPALVPAIPVLAMLTPPSATSPPDLPPPRF